MVVATRHGKVAVGAVATLPSPIVVEAGAGVMVMVAINRRRLSL